jgi:hypothetical protein
VAEVEERRSLANNLIITSYYLVHGCTLRAQVLMKLFV